jgi:hypothetical protein
MNQGGMELKLSLRAFLCVVSIVALLPAVAEASFGIKGGIVEPDFVGDGLEEIGLTSDDIDRIHTYAAAIHLDMAINSYFSLRPEFLYIQKGAQVPSYLASDYMGSDTEVDVVLTYMSVPLALKMRIPTGLPISPYLFGGGYLAFSQEGEYRFDTVPDGAPEEQEIDDLRETTYGFLVGGGVKLGTLIAEVRYSEGLSTIFDIEGATDGDEDPDIYNRTISFLFGFDFD